LVTKVVLDSTVFIDYSRAQSGPFEKLAAMARLGSLTLYTPSVVIAELWTGRGMNTKAVRVKMERLLQITKTVPLTKQLAKSSGELFRATKTGNLFDAVVAATALYLDAQLATSNQKHFSKIKGLKLHKFQ